jgi:hypothetical protein
MESQTKLFDSTKEFTIKILSGGEKVCTVRFPTDDEWMQRASRRKTIQHMLGRNKTRSKVVNGDALDAELFAKIRLADGETTTFDEAEASAVIARIEQVTVKSIVREGDKFRITLAVPGAITEHLLRMPLRVDADAYADESVSVTGGRRENEIRVNLDPAGRLYDKICISSTGYAGAVPIVHKDVAVFEVISELRAMEEDIDLGN